MKNGMKNKIHYIFMGYNEIMLLLLPSGLGIFFPEFLKYENGVDNSLTDLIILLFDSGIRKLSFQKILKELHTKECYRLMIYREHKVMDRKFSSIPSLFDSEYF